MYFKNTNKNKCYLFCGRLGSPTPAAATIAAAGGSGGKRALCARHTAPPPADDSHCVRSTQFRRPWATNAMCFAHSPAVVGGGWTVCGAHSPAAPTTGRQGCVPTLRVSTLNLFYGKINSFYFKFCVYK